MSDARHIPVMVREVVEALQPRAGGRYLDGTFGAGGYSAAMLDSAACQVIALDAATGAHRWTFFTDAPVRFAPAIMCTI